MNDPEPATNVQGARAPKAASAINGAIDAVLVVGLGFDRRGFRLGYGSGYFDRFLRRRPFPVIFPEGIHDRRNHRPLSSPCERVDRLR